MADLYAELGLDKDATLNDIKKAYKKMSKKHHPDAGGDPDDFIRLDTAYKVLSDPERKRIYDETGYYEDGSKVKSIEEEALTLITKMMQTLLLKYKKMLVFINIVDETKQAILKAMDSCREDVDINSKIKEALLNIADKVHSEEKKKNIVQELLLALSRQPEQVEIAGSRFLAIAERALQILENYNYEPPEMTPEEQAEFEEAMKPKNPLEALLGAMGGM